MKKSLLSALFFLIFLSASWAQGINITSVDAGPYTPGSTIAALMNTDNSVCIQQGNIYNLFLSDASGDFTNEVNIGSFSGFYSIFVNGIIPLGTPTGTGYKVRIKSTMPAAISAASSAFSIQAGAAVEAKINSTTPELGTSGEIFGNCSGRDPQNFLLINQSTAASNVTASITNELSGTSSGTLTFDVSSKNFSAELAHYTAFIKAVNNGTVATKAYLLVNNQALTAFVTSGNNTVCLINGIATLNFSVTINGNNGIGSNYPGNIYRIQWGDGSQDTYTICDIRNSLENVFHQYMASSCGRTISSGNGSVFNAYGINISVESSFCGPVGTPISTFAKVINKPKNDFSNPGGACLNQPATFVNTSEQGQDPNNASAGCQNNDVKYTWFVDGQPVSGAINVPKSYILNYTFSTAGSHIIRLESNSANIPCPADPYETTICVQQPAIPSFTLNGTDAGIVMCNSASLKPANTSFVDNTCGTNTYIWEVTGGTAGYLNGTTFNSPEPEFNFSTPGIYQIKLRINSSACNSAITAAQTVIVNTTPTAQLSPDVILCNLSDYNFNATTTGPTRTLLNGTVQPEANTYTWTITGGAYEFINGTDEHTAYPNIKFKEYAAYTIEVSHQNNCGIANDTQQITFQNAPTVNAGTYPDICYDGTIALNGNISAPVDSYSWVGGTGSFSPDRNTLDAVYTPSQAERDAGTVDLTLRAVTALAAPCNVIEHYTTIKIKRANRILSDAIATICTGEMLNYTPLAVETGSTFSWTVKDMQNANGANAGSGTKIEDELSNTTSNQIATVTYTITPAFDGCNGVPFDLVVSINPKPILSTSVNNSEICSGIAAIIDLAANLSNTTYTWTSSASSTSITGFSQNNIPTTNTQINEVLINSSTTAGTVTYTITPISDSGCQGEAETVIFTVKGSAENTIGADQAVCINTEPLTLIGNVPTGGDAPYTYRWEMSTDNGNLWAPINGATLANFDPPALTVNTAYRRIVSSSFCVGALPNYSNVVNIRVNPDAKAQINANTLNGCAPFVLDAANVSAFISADNGTYNWYADGVSIGTGATFPGYTITNPASSVTIKLEVISSAGCSDAETTQVFTTSTNVIPSFIQDIHQGCGTQIVTFTNQSNITAGVSFLWDFGNGETSNLAVPPPVTYLPDDTGADKIYTVTLTASTACTVPATSTSSILVKNTPVALFSPDKVISCSPMTVNFSNTTPLSNGTVYTYNFGDGSPIETPSDRSTISHTFTTGSQNSVYTITMTAKNECGESTKSHTITVTPNTVVAELVVNSPDLIGCVPFTVPFYNNSGGATHFVYDFGDGTPPLTTYSTPEVQKHTFNAPGTYTVTLTASSSCGTNSTTETITVLPLPQTDFTAPETAFENQEVPFTNLSDTGLIYAWDFGDGSTSSEFSPTHIYPKKGIYEVKLITTNQNNCSSMVVKPVIILPEPGKLFIPNSFIPGNENPEIAIFKAKGIGLAKYHLMIFDKWGEMMWDSKNLIDDAPADGWDGIYKGQLMPQGVYYWRMEATFKNGNIWQGMSYKNEQPRNTGMFNLIR